MHVEFEPNDDCDGMALLRASVVRTSSLLLEALSNSHCRSLSASGFGVTNCGLPGARCLRSWTKDIEGEWIEGLLWGNGYLLVLVNQRGLLFQVQEHVGRRSTGDVTESQ